jgi:hypothetical protein
LCAGSGGKNKSFFNEESGVGMPSYWKGTVSMRSGNVLWVLFFSLFMLSACDDKKEDYSGFAKIVEERNEARQAISKENLRKKTTEKQGMRPDSGGYLGSDKVKNDKAKNDKVKNEGIKKTEISPIVMYQRDIDVVDSSSRKSLAKGIAYLNKEGRIIKIKILKE